MNMRSYAKALLYVGLSLVALYLFATAVVDRLFFLTPPEQRVVYGPIYAVAGIFILVNCILGIIKVGDWIFDRDRKETDNEEQNAISLNSL